MQCPSCHTELPAGSRFCAACGKPVPGMAGGPASPSSDKWIVAIVLGVVGIIAVLLLGGIVAAIAIPNLLNAIDRGKQKRTMADIRSIATAIESYRLDHEAYPVASDIREIEPFLEPEYIAALPVTDGWDHGLHVASTREGYEVVSAGKDGMFQGCNDGVTRSFEADICFANGQFVQWPEGTQH